MAAHTVLTAGHAATPTLIFIAILPPAIIFSTCIVLFFAADYSPLNIFYRIVSAPINALNNIIAYALNRAGMNRTLLKALITILYIFESSAIIVGFVGVQLLALLPLQAALIPIIGSTFGIVFATLVGAYNILKIGSWATEHLDDDYFVRFTLQEQNQQSELRYVIDLDTELTRPNRQRQTQGLFTTNIQRNQNQPHEEVPTQQDEESRKAIAAVWEQAITTRNLSELLEKLQTQYSSSHKLFMTKEMLMTYKLSTENHDGFWQIIPEEKISKIESENQDLCDPLLMQFMRIPVIVTTTDQVTEQQYEHSFDLVSILLCLTEKKENPINRLPIYNLLQQIKVDENKYKRICEKINRAALDELLKGGKADEAEVSALSISGGPDNDNVATGKVYKKNIMAGAGLENHQQRGRPKAGPRI
jgi:hypothetical protein